MSACCTCPVERHAYNGCANCGCCVPWWEHPDRDSDRSEAAHPARIAELERLRAEVAELRLIRAPKREATDEIAIVNMQPDDPLAELAKAVRLWQVEAAEVVAIRALLDEACKIADALDGQASVPERDQDDAWYERQRALGERVAAIRAEGGVAP